MYFLEYQLTVVAYSPFQGFQHCSSGISDLGSRCCLHIRKLTSENRRQTSENATADNPAFDGVIDQNNTRRDAELENRIRQEREALAEVAGILDARGITHPLSRRSFILRRVNEEVDTTSTANLPPSYNESMANAPPMNDNETSAASFVQQLTVIPTSPDAPPPSYDEISVSPPDYPPAPKYEDYMADRDRFH